MTENIAPELLSGSEARRYLGMIPAVWLELLETEQLPRPVRIHIGPDFCRHKWRKADLDRWIASRELAEMADDE